MHFAAGEELGYMYFVPGQIFTYLLSLYILLIFTYFPAFYISCAIFHYGLVCLPG